MRLAALARTLELGTPDVPAAADELESAYARTRDALLELAG